jgi:Tol biopolymer transport system component
MKIVLVALISFLFLGCAAAENKPKVTFDEFFNSVSFSSLELSPDGNSVVIGTDRADWDEQIFRKDLWLYRIADKGSLIQLTESGHDTDPKWSPDGRWIAFLSDRKSQEDDSGSDDDDDGSGKTEGVGQIYLISPNGGEAFAVTRGAEEVHALSWSPDSKTLYFATRNPWTKLKKMNIASNGKMLCNIGLPNAATPFLRLIYPPSLRTMPRLFLKKGPRPRGNPTQLPALAPSRPRPGE